MGAFYVAALAIVAVLATGALFVFGGLKGWWTKRRDLGDLVELLRPHARVFRPSGDGPFPAVLQLHGCGGVRQVQTDYAQAARAAGVLVVVLDSLTPRGISYEQALRCVCKGYRLRGRDRAGDVAAGLEMVRSTPDVNADRIAIAAWSHGAWAVMDLLAMHPDAEKPDTLHAPPSAPFRGVHGLYLTYPFCGFPALTRQRGWAHTDAPGHVVRVEDDATAKHDDIQVALDKARATGARITEEKLTGVTHGFDENDHHPNSAMVYNADASARAHKRYVAWLLETIGADQ